MKKIKINLLRAAAIMGLVFMISSFAVLKYKYVGSKKDAEFLEHAAKINLDEIKLGQLAQSKSMMADVKELGKMMEDTHSKSLKELTILAKKKDVMIPMLSNYNTKESYKNLETQSGSNFDRTYCKLTIDGHKDAIELFEKAAKESDEMDVKKWAEDTLPILRKHLAQSVTCLEKCEKVME